MQYLPFILFFLFVVAFFLLSRGCGMEKFNERFPPIDDEEFIRRCRPGVNRNIALRVRRVISESLGIEYNRVYPDQKFVEDLGC